MRILSISAQKPDSTGSGTYLNETVRALDALGHTQAVICGLAPEDAPDLPEGVTLLPVRFQTDALPFPVAGMSDDMPYAATRYRDFTPNMLERFKSAFAAVIAKALDEFAPDLIVCHHLYIVTAVAAREVALRDYSGGHRPRLVAVCHGTDLRQMSKHALDADFIRHGIHRLDAIFALHGPQVEDIAACYGVPTERVSVLGTGYNPEMFHMQPGLRDPHGKVAVYAGKIWGKKGVKSLIASLDYLPYGPDEFTLLLAGGYNDEAEYRAIVNQAAESRYPIEFLGRLDQPALARAYNSAQVFVLPSFFEGLPLVLVEALACGCRAVVTDLPGIRPWMDACIPTAPIRYVPAPRMVDIDTPLSDDLPAFDKALSAALEASFDEPSAVLPAGLETLSWQALAQRAIELSDLHNA